MERPFLSRDYNAKNRLPAIGREPVAVCGLPLDIVIHVHQVADGAHIIGDVGIAVDGVLDGAAGHCKVDHIHGLVVVQHGVDEAAGEGIAAAHAVEDINAGSAYAHYRFSLLCDTNVRQHFYLPITQPASIERCNGDGGEQFARTSVQLKQCFVLSAHLHCSLGLGICIAHWL